MCELPEPIKDVLFIAIACLLIDIIEDGITIFKGYKTKWSVPSLVAGTVLVSIMAYITYYYW